MISTEQKIQFAQKVSKKFFDALEKREGNAIERLQFKKGSLTIEVENTDEIFKIKFHATIDGNVYHGTRELNNEILLDE
jgi:hypothetical protein